MRFGAFIAIALSILPACAWPTLTHARTVDQQFRIESSTRALDSLLESNATRALGGVFANMANTDEVMQWLRERASDGHVIAQYELALRLSRNDKSASLDWFAAARLNAELDEQECADRRAASEVARFVDIRYSSLEHLADKDELLFAPSLEKAISLPIAKGGKQPPWWICAENAANPTNGNLLAEPRRALLRKLKWDALYARDLGRSMEARLSANINPDRLPMRKLDEQYWKGKGNLTQQWSGLNVVWLDENRVAFGGYRFAPSKSGVVIGPFEYDPIRVWDVETGKVEDFAGPGGGVCLFKGYISYSIRRDGKWVRYEGFLGDVKEVVSEPKGTSGQYDYFQCRRFSKSESPHRWPLFALESGGYYAGTDLTRKKPAEFHPQGTQDVRSFQLFEGINEVTVRLAASRPRYSEYLNASWIPVTTGTIRTTNPHRAWLLFPDGRVVKHDFPPGPWASSGSTFFEPAKPGWLAGSAARGLYLLGGSTTKKLVEGHIQAMRVSASGCRVAVMIRMKRRGHPLWVIDLCQHGSEHVPRH